MPARKPRTKKQKRAAMKEVMDEFKAGSLHSGSDKGPKVNSRKQAIAIGLSESGQSRKKKGYRQRVESASL
jgi:23S rRNA G2445 N2-methylase RlmL